MKGTRALRAESSQLLQAHLYLVISHPSFFFFLPAQPIFLGGRMCAADPRPSIWQGGDRRRGKKKKFGPNVVSLDPTLYPQSGQSGERNLQLPLSLQAMTLNLGWAKVL